MCNKIKIVETHEQAIVYWHECYIAVGEPLKLITFDFHTDTHSAFCSEISKYYSGNINYERRIKKLEEIMNNLHQNGYDIHDIASRIKNDEQIATAIGLGILEEAFIIAHEATVELPERVYQEDKDDLMKNMLAVIKGEVIEEPTRPFNYEKAEDGIYQALYRYRDNSEVNTCDLLSDRFIKDKFQTFFDMNPNAFWGQDFEFNGKFILDIDLDYFFEPDSLSSNNINFFRRLLKNSEMITIAREPFFVEKCSNGTMNADDTLKKLIHIINSALH